ncbi:LD-carboxypeptidase [Erythrobacter sp. A6_0]|uniref:S66 peptidase family protein n=1 Tax=Erythrobacter sp. A6_0 TaxID=2821089 RepID=UPI001ADAF4D2|nr:LD-carboxypeptidase [Erythrobacter sp. A6_0]
MTTRRAALGGLAALAASPLLPAPSLARGLRKPSRLRLGDTVGLVAPASAVSERQIANALFTVRGMGLVPRLGKHVADTSGYLAGDDAARASDLDTMFADPDISAIFAVRGGWGSARILPLLDWKTIRRNPKLLIGFSDLTALHLAIAKRAGFMSLHAPNAASSWPENSWNSLWRMAFTGETPVLGGTQEEPGRPLPLGRTITPGRARGRLLGGNLTVLTSLMGTPWLPDFDGAVLFLEDIAEAEYRIDRMLQHLSLAGVLGRLAGVVFGRCSACATTDPDYEGFSLDEVLDTHLAPLGIPAFVGANIGHLSNQLSLPHGGEVEIDAQARTIRLLEPMVA